MVVGGNYLKERDIYSGKTFLLIFQVFNAVILLNFVIAVLSATYSELQPQSLGLYYDTLINTIKQRSSTKYNSALTSTYQILSPLMFALLPLYIVFKPRSRQIEQINRIAMLILYFPISVVLLVVFVTLNLLVMPFAYFAAIINKIQIIKKFSHLERKPQTLIADLIAFVVIGWLFLLVAQFNDSIRFYSHLFLIRGRE